MGQPSRNVELKALDPDPVRSLAVCRELGADDRGEFWQRDTYFAVSRGRLKLREQQLGSTHLIQYDRADRPDEHESHYQVVEVADPATFTAVLARALPVRVIVAKRRRLLFCGRVRIHLDTVEGLGNFLEIEAVAPASSDLSNEHRAVARLRAAFAIQDDQLVASGYADQLEDQLLRRGRPPGASERHRTENRVTNPPATPA